MSDGILAPAAKLEERCGAMKSKETLITTSFLFSEGQMKHGLPGAIAHRRKRLRLHLQRSEKAELHLAAEWINGKALITQNDYTPPPGSPY